MGRGGIDLLLRSRDGGLPIIAEVKAPRDGNLFVALVQALTYAAELATANQFERLSGSYREFESLDLKQLPRCDIYVIYFRADKPNC